MIWVVTVKKYLKNPQSRKTKQIKNRNLIRNPAVIIEAHYLMQTKKNALRKTSNYFAYQSNTH